LNGAIQTGGFVLGLLGFILNAVAIFLPDWKANDKRLEIIEAIFKHQGLWARCLSQTTGQWHCDDWDAKILGLPVELQVGRWLAVICLICGVVAIAASIIGLECSSCLRDEALTKSRISKIAACCWIASALWMGAAVSFYAYRIVNEYHQANLSINNSSANVWVFGNSLFFGWAGMFVGVLGGIIMLCGSSYDGDEEDGYLGQRLGRGVRRMRESFRDSYRAIRPRPQNKDVDYV